MPSKKTKGNGKKGKKGKKGKGKKKGKSKIENPEEREFDYIEKKIEKPTPPTLYEAYNTLPAVDSFFGQFLIGVETDQRFDEFKPKGNQTLNLMLQQQTNTTKLPPSRPTTTSTSNKKDTKKVDDVVTLPSIDDLAGLNDPLPTSWKQRLEAAQSLHPQRTAFDPEKEIFICNECEILNATHLCVDCGNQYFCGGCVKKCHVPKYRNGLLGHKIVSLQDLTEIPYIEPF